MENFTVVLTVEERNALYTALHLALDTMYGCSPDYNKEIPFVKDFLERTKDK